MTRGDSVQWDGSPLTVRDMQKMMPDVISGFFAHDGVLYVRTRDNPWAPVPYGWHVRKIADGIAEITENA